MPGAMPGQGSPLEGETPSGLRIGLTMVSGRRPLRPRGPARRRATLFRVGGRARRGLRRVLPQAVRDGPVISMARRRAQDRA